MQPSLQTKGTIASDKEKKKVNPLSDEESDPDQKNFNDKDYSNKVSVFIQQLGVRSLL